MKNQKFILIVSFIFIFSFYLMAAGGTNEAKQSDTAKDSKASASKEKGKDTKKDTKMTKKDAKDLFKQAKDAKKEKDNAKAIDLFKKSGEALLNAKLYKDAVVSYKYLGDLLKKEKDEEGMKKAYEDAVNVGKEGLKNVKATKDKEALYKEVIGILVTKLKDIEGGKALFDEGTKALGREPKVTAAVMKKLRGE